MQFGVIERKCVSITNYKKILNICGRSTPNLNNLQCTYQIVTFTYMILRKQDVCVISITYGWICGKLGMVDQDHFLNW